VIMSARTRTRHHRSQYLHMPCLHVCMPGNGHHITQRTQAGATTTAVQPPQAPPQLQLGPQPPPGVPTLYCNRSI
jgi:hypothetical protein